MEPDCPSVTSRPAPQEVCGLRQVTQCPALLSVRHLSHGGGVVVVVEAPSRSWLLIPESLCLKYLGQGLAPREHGLQRHPRRVGDIVFSVLFVLPFRHLMTGAESPLTLGIAVVLVRVTDEVQDGEMSLSLSHR